MSRNIRGRRGQDPYFLLCAALPHRIFNGPLDVKRGVIPFELTLRAVIISIIHVVDHLAIIREGTEPICKTSWDKKHTRFFAGKSNRAPLAERWRVLTYSDKSPKTLSLRHTDQLALILWGVEEVKPSDRSFLFSESAALLHPFRRQSMRPK